MQTKHLYLLLLLMTFGLVSCKEEENDRFYLYELTEVYDPNIPVSSVYVSIIGGKSVGIAGGTAPYTVSLSNDQLATLTLNEEGDIVHISPLRLGVTTLVVGDADGRKTQIGVKIGEGTQTFTTQEVSVDVAGNMDEAVVTELKQEVLRNADMKEGGNVRFTYISQQEGSLTITSAKVDPTVMTGDFTKETKWIDKQSYPYFYTFYDGNNHEFHFEPFRQNVEGDAIPRALGPQYCRLIEDVTDFYKEEYPQAESVRLCYYGYLIN